MDSRLFMPPDKDRMVLVALSVRLTAPSARAAASAAFDHDLPRSQAAY